MSTAIILMWLRAPEELLSPVSDRDIFPSNFHTGVTRSQRCILQSKISSFN